MMPLPPQQPKPSPAYLASLRQRMAAAPSTQEMARGLDIPPIHEYSIFEYAYDFNEADFPDGIFTKGDSIMQNSMTQCCLVHKQRSQREKTGPPRAKHFPSG